MSKLEMLTPQNSAIALIDYQPAMYQGVQSHDRLVTFNNVQVLAKAAKLFGIPSVISTIAKDSFSGPFMPEVTALFPEHKVIDRTAMNACLTRTSTKRFRRSAARRSSAVALALSLVSLQPPWSRACSPEYPGLPQSRAVDALARSVALTRHRARPRPGAGHRPPRSIARHFSGRW
jgi:nicotinamidase-related amidase